MAFQVRPSYAKEWRRASERLSQKPVRKKAQWAGHGARGVGFLPRQSPLQPSLPSQSSTQGSWVPPGWVDE